MSHFARAATACLFFSLALLSCQPPANPPGSGTLDSAAFSIYLSGGSVYVAGQYWDGLEWVGCYWQDGARVDTAGSVSLSIYVDGSGNVYTGGQENGFPEYGINATYFVPDLSVYSDGITGEVRSIVAPGGNVTAVGIDHNGAGQHTYFPWEGVVFGANSATDVNGAIAGSANSVVSLSGTTYVVGQYYDGTNWLPYCWVAPPSSPSSMSVLPGGVGDADSVYVDSGTVYASGQVFNGRYWVPCYWADAAITRLAGDGIHNASANGIFVDGGTVYTAGDYYDGTNWTPCYWTDATRTDLPGASQDTFVGSVFELSGTVYTAGYYYDGTKYVACYWIGTTRIDLPGVRYGKEAGRRSVPGGPRPFTGEASHAPAVGAANSRRS